MKIDPKIPANGELESSQVQNTGVTPASVQNQPRPAATGASQTEDTFQPSSRHAEVQQLSAQLANVPEIRSAKVAPLQAKLQRGAYKPDSQKVADSLLADQNFTSPKR